MLAKGIGTLTNLDPERELSTILQQAVVATRQLLDVTPLGHAARRRRLAALGQRL
jgi:hypothetical protein